MKSLALISSAAIALASPAAHAAPVDWTGWYWGVNAGYAVADADASRSLSGSGYFAGSSITSIETNSRFDLSGGGFTGGGQYGYNQNLGTVVIGAEADFNYAGAEDTANVTVTYPCCGPATYTSAAEFDQSWLATFRGKAGVLAGPALIYATAGVAAAEVSLTQGFSDTNAPFAFTVQRHSDTLFGWTAGAGVEFAVADGLSLRLEYLYADLGDVSVGPTPFLTGYPDRLSETSADVVNQSVRLGANWHF